MHDVRTVPAELAPYVVSRLKVQAALDIADRVYLLETGEIVAAGTAGDMRGNDSVRKAYLGY